MKNKLILLRGLPGSGKTTVAKLFGDVPHFEADMFFLDDVGNYNYDQQRLPHAHKWCLESTRSALVDGHPIVVVSNTFTRVWELEMYYLIADKFNYEVVSLVVENRHGGKNSHEVSDEKIETMRNRFQIKL